MPHITTWEGLLVASGRDELIGKFDHYIELENGYARNGFPPAESAGVVYEYQCPEPVEPTPFEVNKEVVSIQDHNRFNPGPFQEGSAIFPGHGVIAEDHSAGSFRDSLTGEGRPTKIWTTGGASTFEDRHVGDYDANDAVFSMRENVDWTAANGGPGSSYLAAKTVSQSNAYVGEDSVLNWLVDGDMKLGDIVEGLHDSVHCITEGCGQNAPIGDRFPTDNIGTNSGPGGSSFMTETFEPAAGMDNFGESLNPVPELGGKSGPGGTSF